MAGHSSQSQLYSLFGSISKKNGDIDIKLLLASLIALYFGIRVFGVSIRYCAQGLKPDSHRQFLQHSPRR
jgi:hypothetical protein